MKQILKRVSALFAAALCSAALVLSGSTAVFAAEGANEELAKTIESAVTELTDQLVQFSDEELADLKATGTDFGVAAVEAWEGAKAEVGTFNSIGEASVEYKDKLYSATVPADFETYDANFVYIFDELGTPVSLTVDIQYPMSVNMKRAGMNTLMGLGTVFLVLVFLMVVISMFKYIGNAGKKKTAAPAPAPAPVPVPVPAVEEEYTDDTELIAVIAAAIAASEGAESTDGFVVRSIRKVNRKVR